MPGTRREAKVVERMWFKRSWRCEGSSRVPCKVSISHPSTSLRVAQQASPLPSFFQGDWFAPRGRVISRVIGAEDSVIDVEKLPPECVEGRGIALGHQNFVVDEYVSIAEGAAATAGPDRGGHGDRPLQSELRRRGRWNGEREGGVPHRGGGCGDLERMWRWRPGGVGYVVGQVHDRLGRAAKVWWAFGPTHGKNQGYGDQRGLSRSDGKATPSKGMSESRSGTQ